MFQYLVLPVSVMLLHGPPACCAALLMALLLQSRLQISNVAHLVPAPAPVGQGKDGCAWASLITASNEH
jgi:hypothetical protein